MQPDSNLKIPFEVNMQFDPNHTKKFNESQIDKIIFFLFETRNDATQKLNKNKLFYLLMQL